MNVPLNGLLALLLEDRIALTFVIPSIVSDLTISSLLFRNLSPPPSHLPMGFMKQPRKRFAGVKTKNASCRLLAAHESDLDLLGVLEQFAKDRQ